MPAKPTPIYSIEHALTPDAYKPYGDCLWIHFCSNGKVFKKIPISNKCTPQGEKWTEKTFEDYTSYLIECVNLSKTWKPLLHDYFKVTDGTLEPVLPLPVISKPTIPTMSTKSTSTALTELGYDPALLPVFSSAIKAQLKHTHPKLTPATLKDILNSETGYDLAKLAAAFSFAPGEEVDYAEDEWESVICESLSEGLASTVEGEKLLKTVSKFTSSPRPEPPDL